MQAKDIMTTSVITVLPKTTVQETAALLLRHRISAVPVVDEKGGLLGIVSEGDLMRRPESGTEPHHSWWLRLLAAPEDDAREYLRTHGLTAGDVMTRKVITAEPETPLAEIAEILEKRRIKRLPVVRNGQLAGIVSRADLLRSVASQKAANPAGATPDDADIRKRLMGHLAAEGLPGDAWINPIVSDGVVHLWGLVESQAQREAIRVATESIAGVRDVVNNIGVLDGRTRAAFWAD